jgi:hypothetical protein
MGALFTSPSSFFSTASADTSLSQDSSGDFINYGAIQNDMSNLFGGSIFTPTTPPTFSTQQLPTYGNPTAVQTTSLTDSLISGLAQTGESILKTVFGVPSVPSGASYITTTNAKTGQTTTELINNSNALTSFVGVGGSAGSLLFIGGAVLLLVLLLNK